MKCPKCYFIGFDDGQRCKNCGYQFSLSIDKDPIELPLKTGDEPLGPFADFAIEPGEGQRSSATTADDLPLFGFRGEDDDRPLVTLPASPRAPVAVRKSSPVARPAPARRPPAHEPELDLDPVEDSAPPRRAPSPPVAEPQIAEVTAGPVAAATAASVGARLGAAFIDLVLLLLIDAAVLYFTLRICGLTLGEWHVIPPWPFLAFIAMLNGGYMAGATAASGQSLGKLAAGIKVVTDDPEASTDRVPVGQAILRSAAYLASALPVGLGFLPAVMGGGRALHDRLAHTRVVKA